jgi:hypothetical protein
MAKKTNLPGARARRGADNEPKRKRARKEGCLTTGSHAAKPPRSGRDLHNREEIKLSPLSVEEAIKWQSIAALHRAEGNMTEAGAMEARAAEALDVALTPLDP